MNSKLAIRIVSILPKTIVYWAFIRVLNTVAKQDENINIYELGINDVLTNFRKK